MPTSSAQATRRHVEENVYRYSWQHFGLNRAQRREVARRHPHTKKLMVEPATNVSYMVVSDAT